MMTVNNKTSVRPLPGASRPRFRIKKGVRPYGGRSFWGAFDDNEKTVTIYVDSAIGHKAVNIGGDPRTYLITEVDFLGWKTP